MKLKAKGRVFSGDACNCFDGVSNEAENISKARVYWENKTHNEKPVIETIVDGEIIVEEIIECYK